MRQIIDYPQTIIERIDASDQSRSAQSAPPQSSDPSPGRGRTKLILGADLVPALDPLALVSLQSRQDQRNHPVGDDLVASGAEMKRVIKDLALGGIEHIA